MIIKNKVLYRENNKPIVWDVFFEENRTKKPLVIFCHGYKGFKDWGAWDIVAQQFKDNGFFFLKFNFSHNGGTIEQPIDFPDLEAFGQNNYSKELEDLDDILHMITSNTFEYADEIDSNTITLIGHSRGGGISILKAAEDQRISKLITWASVSSFGKRTATVGDLEQWKRDGVKYIINGRTKQQMPHYYQFYEDFKANEKRLDISRACQQLEIPHLIIHGSDDDAVRFSEAQSLDLWSQNSRLIPIEGANHVFNTKHPWQNANLPEAFQNVIDHSIAFAQ